MAPLPCWTLVMAGLAGIVYLEPTLAAACLYDRQAVLQGQVWRLATAPLVHFDPWHLGYNLAALLLSGWLLEARLPRLFPGLALLTALATGLYLALGKPLVATYGGLSGLASGNVVYLALAAGAESQGTKSWGWLLLGVVLAKLAFEAASGDSWLFYPSQRSFHLVWESHALGGLAALGLFSWQRRRRRPGQ